MGDSFTETTSQGWGSRIMSSIKGVLFGGAFFLVAFPLLVWNEGRAVTRARSLEEGAGAVVSVPDASVTAGHEGKLVHMSGQATTSQTLADPEFAVSVSALRLRRTVEMYQWKEDEKSETKNKIGGGTETVKTYSYVKTWDDDLIDSGRFRHEDGHENPGAKPFSNQDWSAEPVKLGGFRLSSDQVSRLDRFEPLSPDPKAVLPAATAARVKVTGSQYYAGKDPNVPAIGDARVTFQVARPAEISVVALQVGDTFEGYHAKAGGTVDLLEYGVKSADAMFKAAQDANTLLTWILRGVGFFVMFLGLTMVFNPLRVLGDVIPILGTLMGAGIALFAGAVAAALSLVTIAIAWLAYRPVLGIVLLVLAGAAIVGLVYMSKARKPVPARA
jgi:hypothetical protein